MKNLPIQIIKNLRDVHENKVHEIRRMEGGIEQWVHGGRINAVAFEVDTKVTPTLPKKVWKSSLDCRCGCGA